MISRVIMLGAAVLWAAAFYFRRKQKFYRDLFQTLRDCQKYHMDYVQDLSHLPINQNIIVYGPPQPIEGQSIIASSFIKKSAEPDRLWKMKLKNRFQLQNAVNQPLQITNTENNDIFVFNLPPTQRPISNLKFEERAIIEGMKICVYGKVKSQALNKKFQMVPEFIIGNQHESLLTFLDKHIISLSYKSKALTFAGVAIFAGHAVYYHLLRPKSDIQKEIDQFKPS